MDIIFYIELAKYIAAELGVELELEEKVATIGELVKFVEKCVG